MTLRAYGAEPHRKIDLIRFLKFVAQKYKIFVTIMLQNCNKRYNLPSAIAVAQRANRNFSIFQEKFAAKDIEKISS